MISVDNNVIVRLLTKDDAEQLKQSLKLQGYFMLIPIHQEMNFLAKTLSPFKRT